MKVVTIVVPDLETSSVPYIGSPRLAYPEQASDFEKEVVGDGLNDLAMDLRIARRNPRWSSGELEARVDLADKEALYAKLDRNS